MIRTEDLPKIQSVAYRPTYTVMDLRSDLRARRWAVGTARGWDVSSEDMAIGTNLSPDLLFLFSTLVLLPSHLLFPAPNSPLSSSLLFDFAGSVKRFLRYPV
jgi:hypothetical protein